MKTVRITWTKSLDDDAVREAMEEACVDTDDEHEQCSGLTIMAAESLVFPFPAEVLGESVEVVDTDCPNDDSFGFDLIVHHQGKRYAIAARCVELQQPLPEGHLYLAAYLKWKASF